MGEENESNNSYFLKPFMSRNNAFRLSNQMYLLSRRSLPIILFYRDYNNGGEKTVIVPEINITPQSNLDNRRLTYKEYQDDKKLKSNINSGLETAGKIGATVAATTAAVPLLSSISSWSTIASKFIPNIIKGVETFSKGMTPSTYFGKGAYSTILGGLNVSKFGAILDNALFSATTAPAITEFIKKPSLYGGVTNTLAVLPVLPFKHKFRNSSGRIWRKSDIISYINSKRGKNLTNEELESFIRDNNLENILMPNGEFGYLEKTEGSVANGIHDILYPPRVVEGAEGRINSLNDLGLTLPQAGKLGYTLDTRNNGQRYSFLDLFSSKGTLRGGQTAFNRMRSSLSGKHGESNWGSNTPEELAGAILRTHFNGNPGEFAIDPYTGKRILDENNQDKIMLSIYAIMKENPSEVSGTYSNAFDNEYSIDSYLLLLKNLRRAKSKGLNLERTRYDVPDGESSLAKYLDTFIPNNYATKSIYDTSSLSPEYQNVLKNHYKNSYMSTDIRGLPEGTTVTKTNDGLEIFYNGLPQGFIRRKSNDDIYNLLKSEIDLTNNILGLQGKDKLGYPEFINGSLRLSNPQFVIYKLGGKLK